MEKQEFTTTVSFAEQHVKTQITIIPDRDPFVAFAQLDFGFIRIKGCTIKWSDFGKGGEPVLTFNLPAYKTNFKYIKAVYFPDTEHYLKLTEQIINAVKGKLNINDNNGGGDSEVEVNPDDIPF